MKLKYIFSIFAAACLLAGCGDKKLSDTSNEKSEITTVTTTSSTQTATSTTTAKTTTSVTTTAKAEPPKDLVLLCQKLGQVICGDISKYGVEYVPVPSDFFCGIFGQFITDDIRPLIKAEREVLGSLQLDDGGFDISWQWYNDYEEFGQAREWWRPRVTLDKLLFYRYNA